MQLPDARTPAGSAGLAALLAEPARAVIALDFDGVLAPIVADPASSAPAEGAIEAVARLSAVVGSVVVITGRPADAVVDLGGFTGHPALGRLVVLGHYGRERWSAFTGETERPEIPPGVDQARRALPGVLADARAPEGTTVEDKTSSLGVHVRNTADPAAAFELLREPLARLAERTGLTVEPGRHVLELRPAGVDKGAALEGYVAEREATSVLYIGDDLGDLPAFAAIERMRRAGIAGVAVCSASDEVDVVAERADLVVDGPPGVVAFLTRLAAAIGSSG